MSLCDACKAFDLANLLDDDGELQDVTLHKSILNLNLNSSICDLCKLFWESIANQISPENLAAIRNESWDLGPPVVVIRGARYVDENWEEGGIYEAKIRCDSLRAYGYFSFYPAVGPMDSVMNIGDIILARHIRPPGEHLGLLQKWVSDCDENHPGCHRGLNQLPTRVVDVGADEGRDPRLIETFGRFDRYMTLSHCWGTHPIIRTTTDTISDHFKTLPLSKLPKTFRDAILVTRAVGIQYLWIDSLCIIQDSKTDWELESAKMGSYYASSYVTIAASASRDSTGGCFVARDESTHVPLMYTQPGTDKPVQVMIRPRPGNFIHLGQRPLHTRAWVLQEKILSARMINFDVDQLLWQCQQSQLAEDGIPYDWDLPSHMEKDRTFNELNISNDIANNQAMFSKFESEWYKMAGGYVERGITKSSDKLPALSGLAKVVKDKTGGEYVAGLWKKDLGLGLLWSRWKSWLSPPAEGYRAPSWSWAALEGAISFNVPISIGSNTYEVVLEDIETDITPCGLDPDGTIESGWLVVTGKVRTFDRRMNPKDPGYLYYKELNLQGPPDDYLLDKGEVVGKAKFDKEFEKPTPLYCLQVATWCNNSSRWYGLLLERTGNEQEYSRVGICHTEYVRNYMWFDDARLERIKIV
ncbi:heterokaryon incompatibility protein [Colletotrichum truncatum]|uniref:Heterokaryon incompatibility protein n=1 Tax=Colletotrichum truncatum TaxID=5467 RepID=A0ACC3Z1W6_COLTU|nr:heterokaryon incompatibility protein [Colletotrichum truncatum]KAF6788809.1 heterokaryon incompatibility protein [Colletotrichum truncatum]